ncbi:hypothetical protein BJY01DRAFT_211357 [Aspergillus pseudoustus]|uniref:Uncharacterized protein n=1 Tax=Aspergillus pseudoustus TaxID=1810923 RepID=A0ABR4K929_9EURO
MVFSFMGTKGRLLQAHFKKHSLSVYASELYDFSTASSAIRSTRVFLHYMSSKSIGITVSSSRYLEKLGCTKGSENDDVPWPLPN